MGVFVSEGAPVLLQAIVPFEGRGLPTPQPLDLRYTVPPHTTAGLFYFRAGSTVGGMVNVSVLRDGKPMRFFSIVADSTVHVSLGIVEDLPTGTRIEVVAAGASRRVRSIRSRGHLRPNYFNAWLTARSRRSGSSAPTRSIPCRTLPP